MSTYTYILQRFLYMILVLFVVSIISFIIIQLPPGDYVTSRILQLQLSGAEVNEAEVLSLKRQYGLDLPPYLQYFKWMWNMFHGDLGRSFMWDKPVVNLIGERLLLTMTISLFTLLFSLTVAIPVGIYLATHQYSFGDYLFTVVSFVGVAIPGFLIALVLLFFSFKYLGVNLTGLFSPNFSRAPWSWGKFLDLLKHIPVPTVIVGASGTAYLIRVMRGCLLDELRKQYVITARAKGLDEAKILFRYPVRIAINPIISTVGYILPQIISGETIVAMVLNLPTTGPLLFNALIGQDMYLAGSFIMILSFLTVIGTFISDLLLVWADPRIRLEKGREAG
ncbi:MAG: ABC transporter permease [bacterium]